LWFSWFFVGVLVMTAPLWWFRWHLPPLLLFAPLMVLGTGVIHRLRTHEVDFEGQKREN